MKKIIIFFCLIIASCNAPGSGIETVSLVKDGDVLTINTLVINESIQTTNIQYSLNSYIQDIANDYRNNNLKNAKNVKHVIFKIEYKEIGKTVNYPFATMQIKGSKFIEISKLLDNPKDAVMALNYIDKLTIDNKNAIKGFRDFCDPELQKYLMAKQYCTLFKTINTSNKL